MTWSVTETVIVVVAGYADDQLRNDLKNCNFDYDVCYVDVCYYFFGGPFQGPIQGFQKNYCLPNPVWLLLFA